MFVIEIVVFKIKPNENKWWKYSPIQLAKWSHSVKKKQIISKDRREMNVVQKRSDRILFQVSRCSSAKSQVRHQFQSVGLVTLHWREKKTWCIANRKGIHFDGLIDSNEVALNGLNVIYTVHAFDKVIKFKSAKTTQ